MTCFLPESCGMLNLDTHILIHALNGLLTEPERRTLASSMGD
jgi:hypothetical protein